MADNKRDYYRIEYEGDGSPRLETSDGTFSVCNLSEGGLMYRSGINPAISMGMRVRGTLVMPDGDRIAVKGSVSRILTLRVAVQFDEMIPLAMIMKEQRRLIQASNEAAEEEKPAKTKPRR